MPNKLKYIFTKGSIKSPPSLILFVTDRCNARCLHCFNWVNVDRDNSRELSLDEIRNIARSLGPLSEVSISGGEPFLRKDLPEILEIFRKNNNVSSFSVPTNGLLPDVIFRVTEEMLAYAGDTKLSVNISLDGTEKEHDRLRQREGSFKKVIETYEKLIPLKNKHNFGIKVLTTLSSRNIESLDGLMAVVKDKMPGVDFHNFEVLRGSPRDPDIAPPRISQLEEVKEKIFVYWKQFNFYGNSFSSKIAYWVKMYLFDIYIQILKKKAQIIPCFAGTLTVVVDASGNVYFCELLPALGNIREKPLRDILSSEEAKKQRRDIRNKKCYCVHSCFQAKNLYLNPKLYFGLLKYICGTLRPTPPYGGKRPRLPL